jgi:hypothetical protein
MEVGSNSHRIEKGRQQDPFGQVRVGLAAFIEQTW